jgi:dTDP-4-dehydrorhamnose 3,5-epimerase
MNVIQTPIEGLLIIEPRVFGDDRGYFFESFNEEAFKKATGFTGRFVQDNQARSVRGVIRGLHFQQAPHAQTKLVRALEGVIWDVVVDLRAGSATYGRWYGVELSAENKRQFLVPQGFAHGYSVLSDTAEMLYKCDDYYSKETEGGVRFDDPALGIDWKMDVSKALLSDKDRVQPLLAEARWEL